MVNLVKSHVDLISLFYPKSVAVIGASDNKEKIGGFIFSQTLKINGVKAFPINNKSSFIQGQQAYSSIKDIHEKIDLVIIVIPGKFVLDILIDCINKKIKNVVIISAGFKETDDEGREREEKIKNLVTKNEINLVGPNCLGILNVEIGMNCSFAKDLPKAGNIALISQSGAVIDAIIDWSFKHNIGFSKIVSLGNMAGIDELEMLEFLANDPKTKAIVFYMETLEKGKKFGKVLKKVSKKKPVIIINPGKSSNAKKAIGSHTGSLAKDSKLVETILNEGNAIIAQNFNELFNILIGLNAKLPLGKKIAIVTNAGGPGVISTDELENTDFELVKFSDDERYSLLLNLPKEASVNNPIDVLGDAQIDRYENVIKSLVDFNKVDNILVLLTPQVMTNSLQIAHMIEKYNYKKTIFSSFIGEKEIREAIKYLDYKKFANFQTPNEALQSMNKLLKYNSFNYHKTKFEYKFDTEQIMKIKKMLAHRNGLLNYNDTKEVLKSLSIQLPNKRVLTSIEDILATNLNPNKKYVLKLDGVIHKKDIGGVKLGITTLNFKSEVTKLFDILLESEQDGAITIEEQFEGTEVIIGLKSDRDLGDFIMFGMGGTYVSLFEDTKFATCPLDREGAKKLIESTKVFKILNGYRGSIPIDFEHLYELLIRISYLQEIYPEIKEVDLNPVICNQKDIYLVDVKLLI